jgi:hypothetical protein
MQKLPGCREFDYIVQSGPEGEKQLAYWLNDDREEVIDWSGVTKELVLARGDHPDYEGPGPRKTIVDNFLPLLRKVYDYGQDSTRFLRLSRDSVEMIDTFNELQLNLLEYPLVQIFMAPYITKCWFAATGDKAREAWAANILFNMAKEGRLETLRVCERNGCGRWFIARRKDGRFCRTKCRVAHYQSDPVFKAKHNEQARAAYAHRTRKPDKTRKATKGRANAKA